MSLLLFPETIPVSEAEVQAWLDRVPNLSASTFRREAYRKAYNVENKIRTAKLEFNCSTSSKPKTDKAN